MYATHKNIHITDKQIRHSELSEERQDINLTN